MMEVEKTLQNATHGTKSNGRARGALIQKNVNSATLHLSLSSVHLTNQKK